MFYKCLFHLQGRVKNIINLKVCFKIIIKYSVWKIIHKSNQNIFQYIDQLPQFWDLYPLP